jgi:hypothetical protein
METLKKIKTLGFDIRYQLFKDDMVYQILSENISNEENCKMKFFNVVYIFKHKLDLLFERR